MYLNQQMSTKIVKCTNVTKGIMTDRTISNKKNQYEYIKALKHKQNYLIINKETICANNNP